jgi:hypothetical protein
MTTAQVVQQGLLSSLHPQSNRLTMAWVVQQVVIVVVVVVVRRVVWGGVAPSGCRLSGG